MKLFLTGLAAGVGISYLMAPRSGKETRNQLNQTVARQTDELKARWLSIAARVRHAIGELKTALFKDKPNLFADMESGKLDRYLDQKAIARRKVRERPRFHKPA